MKKIESLKHEIHNLLRKDAGRALQRMYEVVKPATEIFRNVIIEDNEWTRLKSEYREDLIKREDYIRELRAQNHRIAELIEDLQAEHLAEDLPIREEFRERMLVICLNEDRQQYLAQFFPKDYFPSLSYDIGGKETQVSNFDLLIFDNMLPKELQDESWTSILAHHLQDKKSPYILYLGAWLPLLQEYADKVYATNFVFSIYARIREMSEFMRFFKKTE